MKDNNSTRYHFINVVKTTRDFLGEHCAPLTETDCEVLCEKRDVIDAINKALADAKIEGLKVQLNWSSDQGNSWTQYPKSR